MNIMKIINHPTILKAKPIKVAEGLRPHRIVLRQNGDEFVTHCENLKPIQNGDTLEWHHEDFYWGHYYRSRDEAEADFEGRR